jgi:glycerophosphoryl diester phosphodiesterase
MKSIKYLLVPAIALLSLQSSAGDGHRGGAAGVQLGPRPFFLVDDMADSKLKRRLEACSNGPFRSTDFSIGHRGAALQFPEHTKESYVAAARMGAGILECDVTFTKDKELVCRHAQCDLHTTTNILATPLASKCRIPFTPAVLGPTGNVITAARAQCCASDLTLAEFKSLRGKMDDFTAAATTPQQYMRSSNTVRTDLYSGPTSGTLLTHKESIELFKSLGVKMTPELKEAAPLVMPFDGMTQQQYAQKMIDEYKAAGVSPRKVFPQSFNIEDVRYWVKHEPAFGEQAVYLDDANTVADLPSFATLAGYKAEGINIWAPPIFALLTDDGHGNIVASQWAKDAKAAGLDIITWTLERSGILADGNNGFYYQTFDTAVSREGDTFRVLDALARDVGVLGVFSDWPATTSYYASCMRLH